MLVACTRNHIHWAALLTFARVALSTRTEEGARLALHPSGGAHALTRGGYLRAFSRRPALGFHIFPGVWGKILRPVGEITYLVGHFDSVKELENGNGRAALAPAVKRLSD